MVDLLEKKDDIVKLLFWFNVIILFVIAFYPEEWVLIISTLINIVCLGSFLIIKWDNSAYEQMKKSGKLVKGLDKRLGGLYG